MCGASAQMFRSRFQSLVYARHARREEAVKIYAFHMHELAEFLDGHGCTPAALPEKGDLVSCAAGNIRYIHEALVHAGSQKPGSLFPHQQRAACFRQRIIEAVAVAHAYGGDAVRRGAVQAASYPTVSPASTTRRFVTEARQLHAPAPHPAFRV